MTVAPRPHPKLPLGPAPLASATRVVAELAKLEGALKQVARVMDLLQTEIPTLPPSTSTSAAPVALAVIATQLATLSRAVKTNAVTLAAIQTSLESHK